MDPLYFARLETPFGIQWAIRTKHGVARLTLPEPEPRPHALHFMDTFDWRERFEAATRLVEDPGRFSDVTAWLKTYAGGRVPRRAIPLDPHGTPFQREVWDLIARVPYGSTASYGELARLMGRSPASARAVGGAVGANPVPLIIPCHRVVGEEGGLTGYGGGLGMKEELLRLEGILLL